MVDYKLHTEAQSLGGGVNELAPYRVGKIDPDSDGTGEIFNHYRGYQHNEATGNYAHAEGCTTTASGNYAHAEGLRTKALGSASHVEGSSNTCTGAYSHVEGSSNTCTEDNSHVEGTLNNSGKGTNHVEGIGNDISVGDVNHVEGCNNECINTSSAGALGDVLHLEGYQNKAYTGGGVRHVQGKYNYVDADAIFTLGIGTSEDDRKNAIVVHHDGSVYINGIGGYLGKSALSVQSLQEVIASLLSQ